MGEAFDVLASGATRCAVEVVHQHPFRRSVTEGSSEKRFPHGLDRVGGEFPIPRGLGSGGPSQGKNEQHRAEDRPSNATACVQKNHLFFRK